MVDIHTRPSNQYFLSLESHVHLKKTIASSKSGHSNFTCRQTAHIFRILKNFMTAFTEKFYFTHEDSWQIHLQISVNSFTEGILNKK